VFSDAGAIITGLSTTVVVVDGVLSTVVVVLEISSANAANGANAATTVALAMITLPIFIRPPDTVNNIWQFAQALDDADHVG
jgi:hypothetical protein